MDGYVGFWWPWQEALLNLENKVNAMNLATELRLFVKPTDVVMQKIVGTMLDTYGIVVAAFLVTDKANQVRFFEKPS